VQVLQRQDHRSRGGHCADGVDDGVVELAPGVRLWAVVHRGPTGDPAEHVGPHLRRQQRLDRLDEGLVGRTELGDAGAQQHRGAPPVQQGAELGQQPGLPRARLAAEEGDLPGAADRRLPQLLERVELRPTADERRPRGTGPVRGQRGPRPAGHPLGR